MTTAREVMTADPVIVSPREYVASIAKTMADQQIGCVIVCDDQGELRGIITDRDLAVEVLPDDRDPLTTNASDLLSGRDVHTVDVDDDVEVILERMSTNAVRRLPVLEDGKVVGIVSQGDLATHLDDGVGDLVQAISTADDNTGQG